MSRARLALGLALVVLACPGATARAGTYTVYTCRTPDGTPAGVGDWRITQHDRSVDSTSNGCSRGGPFEIYMADGKPHDANDYIHAQFEAPAGTSIAAYRFYRTAKLGTAYNYRYYEETDHSGDVRYDTCYGSCTAMGDEATPFSGASVVGRTGLTDVHGLRLDLTCSADDTGSSACDPATPAVHLRLYRADVTLSDPYAPTIGNQQRPSGPLVDSSSPLGGVQPVTIQAADQGGGVYQAEFEVDGQIVQATTIGGCDPPFTTKVPCELGVSATVGFDTRRVGDGTHRLRILVTDAAGNVGAWGPITIRTTNTTCNPNPRVNDLKLSAGVTRGHGKHRRLRRSVTVRYGHKVRLRGRLTTPQGAPVAGASLCVAARDDAQDASLRSSGAVTTDSRGRFSFVAGRGPSRRWYFVYRTASGAVTASVMLRVRAPVRMTASRRSLRTGQTIRFAGRVLGGHVPRSGVLVSIQALRVSGWQEFGTAHADRKGHFHFRYRFVRTRGVQRYSLRAVVRRQGTYPYATGASHPLHVRVVG